ncbi:hypothetical protein ACFFGV_12155 [Pontibacillus salicampi]|uniref:Uncharacterized protein n=1 Tax=Pontibacillus salicampi TaxID=1449801 RepID=A0ABV6LPI2_9BACI
MVRKECAVCYRASFSSSGTGEWDCPYCGEDLSSEPVLPIEVNPVFRQVLEREADRRELE